jgi:hypothetical protein
MALEWAALGAVTAAEAIMLLLLTLPGTQGLRKGVITVARIILLPLLTVVPVSLFLLLDLYFPDCRGPNCNVAEQDRDAKFLFKSQPNAVLALGALLLYWLLYSVTAMLVRMEHLSAQITAAVLEHVEHLARRL